MSDSDDEAEGMDLSAIVLDSGSGTLKAGFAGDNTPKSKIPMLVGRPKRKSKKLSKEAKDVFVGQEAHVKRGILQVERPVQNGIVERWDDLEKMWYHAFFSELIIDPEEHAVLLMEAPMPEKIAREQAFEICFESFNIPSSYLQNTSVLSLYSGGRTSGSVVDMGYGITHIAPVHDGYAIEAGVSRVDVSGEDMTTWMTTLLAIAGFPMKGENARGLVNDIKEKLAYCCEDYEEEQEAAVTSPDLVKLYELPDGEIVRVGDARYKCAELAFKPSLLSKDSDGIHQILYQSTMRCEGKVRRDLLANIVVSGGATMFPGFGARLKREMRALAPPRLVVDVISGKQREFGAWVGGSILASLGTFQQFWVSKAEYDESGSGIVHTKCF
jgi:actin-related protein